MPQHTVNGYARRTCLCKRPECVQIWTHWATVNDSKRAGFTRLPIYRTKKTEHALTLNSFCNSVYANIFGNGTPAPKDNVVRYIANHHFPLAFLQDDNRGVLDAVDISRLPTELKEKFGRHDKIPHGRNKGFHFPLPCVSWKDVQRDAGSPHQTDPLHCGPPQRVSPDSRQEDAASRRMQTTPAAMAAEYVTLQRELVEVKLALSRVAHRPPKRLQSPVWIRRR